MTATTKFIHAADVHLDSPLDQLRQLDAATANRLQQASRRSLECIVSVALAEQVAAVVIAGDLFDGPVKDAGAGLWVDSQFKKLSRAGISVIVIRGNHDAHNGARQVMHWSDGVHVLGTDRAESVVLEKHGLAIHGQSFGARAEVSDLTDGYPSPLTGFFNIGLLHTSLAGSKSHDQYAPTTVGKLDSKGYDYWALGHIHQRSIQSLSQQCYVGFSGNTQGRHIRESGAKGFHLVQVVDGRVASVQFQASDSFRWYELSLDLSDLELLGDIEDLLHTQFDTLVSQADQRTLAVRIRLCGSTKLHRELTGFGALEKLADTLAPRLTECGDVWLEKIRLATHPFSYAPQLDLTLPMSYLDQAVKDLTEDDLVNGRLLELIEELLSKSRPELLAVHSPLVNPTEQNLEIANLLSAAHDWVRSRLSSEAH